MKQMRHFYFNELKQREIYKQAKYIEYVDIDGNEVKEVKAIKIAPILLVDSKDNGGVIVKLYICNTMPEGFKVIKGATTNPIGFCWIYNGKSIFSEERRIALLRLLQPENEFIRDEMNCLKSNNYGIEIR